MPDLPAPVTTTDQLLVAVHTELVGLRADIAASKGGEVAHLPEGQVELTEPKPMGKPRRASSRGGS